MRQPAPPTDDSPPSLTKITNKFQFDFRYYKPYMTEGQQKKGGVYVFKTEDLDSTLYDHYITRIQMHRGKHLEQMVIHYRRGNDSADDPGTIVKIKLKKTSDQLEFDVFFARLPQAVAVAGMEVTINWRSMDIDNKGVFYTDTNAYKVVKRDIEA